MGFFPATANQSVAGNLTVAGTIQSTAGAFPSISTNGGMSASFYASSGTPKAYDAVAAGGGMAVAEGSNAKQGVATLVAGTVTVANTSITATSRIFLTTQTPGGTPGWLQVSARVVGTSFTILSSNALDTSVVAYEIFETG